ncbi:hypothetical protein B0E34_07535 [Chryseobacterium mucoviscidosis]|uniref:Uncharacterized protein n=1 Tax=Chryseobacterium mucoviscidosis TaxID=1945581 RepID=A0A202C404_9FLAO|nr:hypothetical protein B0E34_07535 [Chryseobacterium mucoviscidosis]
MLNHLWNSLKSVGQNNSKKANFTIYNSQKINLFIYFSETEVFNRKYQNKTYIINRQILVNLPT